ncbi:relaxase/mobilization nuclease domain-containing protein [Ruegeria atlantica]|uniref:relaxase/mobilization nuclease domain-containing protein n=1 Tax=Ruegeria atlantica TaxID=81569 RepID=UPI00147C3B3F|nr:relaxase/mobilization nuclease domain-containing protein [Ruegeria atlantica]
MTSLAAAYDPAWDALFGEFQLIPNLKPRPGQNPARSRRRSPQRQNPSGGAAGMIANALLTNQAVVKVVPGGGVTASGRLGGQLSYITRKGTVEMERGDTGEVWHGMEGLRDVQDEWAKDWDRMDTRVTNYSYHVILSYPKDTDREAAKQAARSFGARLTNGEYGDRYKYVMAHHDDTGHPHTHLVISRAGASGKTLQISRYGITTQDLRELQVETARDVGIVLTATSRFSRNLRPERESSARVHARRDGRELRERPAPAQRSGFPFFGISRQHPAAADQLQVISDQRNADYAALGETLRSHHAGFEQGFFTTQYPGRAETLGAISHAVLGAASILVTDGVLRSEEIDMNQQVANQMDPTHAPAIDREMKAIGTDVREFITRMDAKAEAMEDEEKRSQTEAAISRVLRDYELLMDEETKTFFGKRLERDDEIEVSLDDVDPTRQRRAAEQDAADPTRTQPIGQDRADSEGRKRADANDPRSAAANAVLKDADRQVAERFEAMGINGDLVLSRIRNGADVDRRTRENWFERDVKTLANAHSLSENQARIDMKAAYKDASEIYRDARGEIRDINRAFAEGRGDDFLQEKIKTGVQDEIQTMKVQGFDRAAIGGRLLEIEDRVQERVTGRAPDRVEGEARPGPEQQGSAPNEKAVSSAPYHPDLDAGVRGQIVEVGSALFKEDEKDSMSPYVDLKVDGRDKPFRVWGVDLPDMMQRENLSVGDTVTLAHDGYKRVTVSKVDPETGEKKSIEANRRAWKASDIERAPRDNDRSREQPMLPDVTNAKAGEKALQARAVRQEVSVETGVTGVIVDAKEALVRPDDSNSKSFYVDMKVEGKDELERIWGTALQDQMARNNISIGDTATFVKAGKEEVTGSRRNPETDEPERVNVTRTAWDVKNLDRQIDRDPAVQEQRRREREERAKGDRGISR